MVSQVFLMRDHGGVGEGEAFRLPSRRFADAEAMRSALYFGKHFARVLGNIKDSVYVRVDQCFEDIDFYATRTRKDSDGVEYKGVYIFINCHFLRCVFDERAWFYNARHCTFDACGGLILDSYGELSRDIYAFCTKLGDSYEGYSGLRDSKRLRP